MGAFLLFSPAKYIVLEVCYSHLGHENRLAFFYFPNSYSFDPRIVLYNSGDVNINLTFSRNRLLGLLRVLVS